LCNALIPKRVGSLKEVKDYLRDNEVKHLDEEATYHLGDGNEVRERNGK
jgi:hypothetical protein